MRKNRLLATLSSLAMGAASVGAVMAPIDAAQAQEPGFFGLVTLLSEACLLPDTQRPGEYFVVQGEIAVRRCCAVLRDVGPENADFLRAVALANAQDPRLKVLDSELVRVLLSCQQDALDRLQQLALALDPTAPPDRRDLYVG